jgi:hypothetical protein
MAAGLGFKDFVTGEVLTAADVDGYLMQGIWVFASAAARSAAVTSPQEGNYSFLKDTNSTEYYDGSAWVAAGGGGGGGKVLQVVQATYSTENTVSSTSYTDSGLSASITPSSASSKIMVLVSQTTQLFQSATSTGGSLNLMRGATQILDRANNSIGIEGASATIGYSAYQSMNFLDSPATTSSTTYKTQQRSTSSGNIRTQPNGSTSTIILLEIGA